MKALRRLPVHDDGRARHYGKAKRHGHSCRHGKALALALALARHGHSCKHGKAWHWPSKARALRHSA